MVTKKDIDDVKDKRMNILGVSVPTVMVYAMGGIGAIIALIWIFG